MKKRILALLIVLCALLLSVGAAFADGEEAKTLTIGEKEYSFADGSLNLAGLKSSEVKEALAAMKKLTGVKTLVLGTYQLTDLDWDDISALSAAAPGAVVSYEFKYNDKAFYLDCETFDLSYVPITDEGEFVRTLFPLMKNLKTVNMEHTGVSNEAMAKIRSDYPQYEILWRIFIGDRYGILSNAEMVLCSVPDLGGDITAENCHLLEYCTKVKYLDLGHNTKLTDLSFVRAMPDLEVAILCINTVQDFSPLADCPKLEYLELFNTGLSDLTPLSKLQNLRHLNICYNFGINDISPLYGLTKLERLWIGKYDPVPPEQIEKMQECAPNCVIETEVNDPTESTWRFIDGDAMGNPRYHPRYKLLREQFDGYDTDSYSIDPVYMVDWY